MKVSGFVKLVLSNICFSIQMFKQMQESAPSRKCRILRSD